MSGLNKPQDDQVLVKIPVNTIESLKKEFGISEEELSDFVTKLIDRKILEHIDDTNAKVFSESQTKEIEDDLKGLGYI